MHIRLAVAEIVLGDGTAVWDRCLEMGNKLDRFSQYEPPTKSKVALWHNIDDCFAIAGTRARNYKAGICTRATRGARKAGTTR